jgi:PAS domain S-box-containing protein
MFRERPLIVVLFCAIVTVCTAVLQYLLPEYTFLDGGLIVVVLLTVFLKEESYTLLFGIICMLLVFISSFYEHDGLERQQIVMQHIFSVIVILLSTVAVLYVKKLYLTMEFEQIRMHSLFEHATEGILLANSKGIILLANPAVEQLFKYSRDELVGKPVEVLIPSRYLGYHETYRNQFHASPSNRRMGHGRDLFARDKFNEEFPVEISLSHFRQSNESYVIAFIIDISKRKQDELRMTRQREELEKVSDEIRQLNAGLENKVQERTLILKEALQELEKSQKDLSEALNKEKELNEIKSRFVSMASHEFRTPLSSVLSSASLLARYTKTEEQDNRNRHINRIKEAVKHLNDLLEDFLSLGKLEEGKVHSQADEFVLKDFLDDIIDEMRGILKPQQQLAAECEFAGNVVTDKKLLKNILINLISNAVKFSPEDGQINIEAKCQQGVLSIKVIDVGIGISREDQQHLFTSFFRGKNVTNIQGTGLGLHIVKRYADLLQANVQLESELGKGTKVTVAIPLVTSNASDGTN